MHTEILNDLWTFTEERVYLLVAIARSKENDDVRATDQPTMRKVIENRDELNDKLTQLEHATSRFNHRYRLYATVNGRNARDALHFLQKDALDAIRRSEKSGEPPHMLKRVDHKWKSILHESRCRDEKRFLWDLDVADFDVVMMLCEELSEHTDIVATVDTPNGFHVVTEPFNYNDLFRYAPHTEEYRGYECERKADDMIFLGFLGDSESAGVSPERLNTSPDQ